MPGTIEATGLVEVRAGWNHIQCSLHLFHNACGALDTHCWRVSNQLTHLFSALLRGREGQIWGPATEPGNHPPPPQVATPLVGCFGASKNAGGKTKHKPKQTSIQNDFLPLNSYNVYKYNNMQEYKYIYVCALLGYIWADYGGG